jgi:transcriptional regulator with XRE-family HTH domain
MPYGIELEDVRYEVDAHGNRTRAILPLTMFTALTEFWIAARRAQTAQIEATTKPGKFKTSLSAAAPSGREDEADPPAPSAPPFKHDQHWQNLIERLPEAAHPSPASSASIFTPHASPAPAQAKPRNHQTFYPREFVAPIPDEVAALIGQGVYFLKAWRMYRGLTFADITDLIGKSKGAIQYFDYGYLKPTTKTLEQFALVFDCTLDQLTVKPKTNTQAWLKVIGTPAPVAEEFAPEDTDYPDRVLHAMIDGKTPLLAWRLYRGWSLADLAGKYGDRVTEAAIKKLEGERTLSAKTRAKLAPILKCTPVQLLKPEGLVIEKRERYHEESPTSRRITQAMMSTGR